MRSGQVFSIQCIEFYTGLPLDNECAVETDDEDTNFSIEPPKPKISIPPMDSLSEQKFHELSQYAKSLIDENEDSKQFLARTLEKMRNSRKFPKNPDDEVIRFELLKESLADLKSN